MSDADKPHERQRGFLDSVSSDQTDDDVADDSFTFEGTPAVWTRRLGRRARVWRASAVVGAVLLVAYLLAGGPAATMAAITALQATHAPSAQAAAQPAFAGASYNPALLPPGSVGATALHIAPAPTAGDTLYACWIAPRSANTDDGPLHLFSTTNLGANWQSLTLPTATAPDCALVVDGANPRNIAALLSANPLTDLTCTLPTTYVSGDGGQSWLLVRWPDALLSACHFHLTLAAGHLFAWADTPLLPVDQTQFTGPGRVIASDDSGQSWRAADTGLPAGARFTLLGMRLLDPSGLVRLLALVESPGLTVNSWLAQSWDNGADWQLSAQLPGVNPQVIVSGDPSVTDHGGWGRLYELAESASSSADGTPHYSLVTGYYNGEWTPMPLPPPVTDVAGDQGGANNSATNDYLNQVSLLAVGPGGHLLALRGALPTDETRQSPRRRIWLWNTESARWLLSDTLFPGNLVITTSAWFQGKLTFWLMTINLTAPPGIVLEYAIFDASNTRLES